MSQPNEDKILSRKIKKRKNSDTVFSTKKIVYFFFVRIHSYKISYIQGVLCLQLKLNND